MPKKKEIVENTEEQASRLPVNWQDQLAGYAKESADNVKPEASIISLKQGVVTYAGTPVPDNKLEIIVLGFINEHTYYEGKYDPNNISSPNCFALGADKDSMVPHDVIVSAGQQKAETCIGCPKLEWGSSESGGRGKACQERYRLIAIPADSIESPEAVLSAEVAIIKLPVTSGKVWNTYISTLSGMFKRPEWAMITELSAKPDQKTQFKAIFNAKSGIDFDTSPELFGAIRQKIELSQAILLKPYDNNTSQPEEAAKDGKYTA